MSIHDLVGHLPEGRHLDSLTQQRSCGGTGRDEHPPTMPAVRDLFYAAGSCRLFRSDDTLRLALSKLGSLWTVSLFFVNALEDIKEVCDSFHLPPGVGGRVWSFVDDAVPDRWMAVCLIGTLHGLHLDDTGVKVNRFLHVYGGLAPAVSVAAESVQLIPWYEYRQWRKKCDWILEASLWTWSGGEDVDTVETIVHAKVSKLAARL